MMETKQIRMIDGDQSLDVDQQIEELQKITDYEMSVEMMMGKLITDHRCKRYKTELVKTDRELLRR